MTNKKSIFSFKQFDVYQKSVSWKVGTDSVLLGAWCSVKGFDQCLDAGCGTGVLSLMVAQRNTQIQVLGYETDESTSRVASHNFAVSPWSDRLRVRQEDILNTMNRTQADVDLLISNPPYFASGLKSPDSRREGARHGRGFTLLSLPALADGVLSHRGVLSVVIPSLDLEELKVRCLDFNLHCTRLTHIRHDQNATCKRVLMEFGRNVTTQEEAELILYSGETATADYRELISPFRDERQVS